MGRGYQAILLVQHAGHVMMRSRTIKIVLHVIISGPDQLDRFADDLRNLRGFGGIIRHVAAPESSAGKHRVHDYLLGLESSNLCD